MFAISPKGDSWKEKNSPLVHHQVAYQQNINKFAYRHIKKQRNKASNCRPIFLFFMSAKRFTTLSIFRSERSWFNMGRGANEKIYSVIRVSVSLTCCTEWHPASRWFQKGYWRNLFAHNHLDPTSDIHQAIATATTENRWKNVGHKLIDVDLLMMWFIINAVDDQPVCILFP